MRSNGCTLSPSTMTSKNPFLTLFRHITTKPGSTLPRITKPIVSAPMNGWSGPKLVAAVSNHGGLPIYPIGYFTDPAKILNDLQSVVPLLDTHCTSDDPADSEMVFMPYAVGFITFWLDRQGPSLLLDILKGRGDLPKQGHPPRPPAAVWFSFGDYQPYLKLVREQGAPGTRVIVQVQTVQEAVEAQKQAVDVIVIQGTESGGHGAQRVSPLVTLLPEVIQALKDHALANGLDTIPPVLAAGGVVTAPQWAAVKALGASGVVVGTGFMTTEESPGPAKAKQILLQTQDGGLSTVRTRIFDDLRQFDWPHGYDGRVIRNQVTEREEQDILERGQVRDAFALLKEDRTGTLQDWTRATLEEDYNLLPLWAGTGVGMLRKQVPAAAFMDQLLGS